MFKYLVFGFSSLAASIAMAGTPCSFSDAVRVVETNIMGVNASGRALKVGGNQVTINGVSSYRILASYTTVSHDGEVDAVEYDKVDSQTCKIVDSFGAPVSVPVVN